MSKNILIIEKSGFRNYIKKSFEIEGWETHLLEIKADVINPKNPLNKLLNIFYRVVFNDKKFLINKQVKLYQKNLVKSTKKIEKTYDIVLVFRASIYPPEVLENLREKAVWMINYEYDGVNIGNAHKIYPLFDANFTFDPNDLRNLASFGFQGITNFYFDEDIFKSKETVKRDTYDLFYVGVGTLERLELIESIQNTIGNKKNLRAYLTIANYASEINNNGVEYRHGHLLYEEAIALVKKSKCLLDFKLSHHNGLSFRFFEAVRYEKKVVTNNKTVRFYDFYHPDNIMITDFNNIEEIVDFLERPYHKLPSEIIEKYSFQNWLSNIMQEEKRIPINLPKVSE